MELLHMAVNDWKARFVAFSLTFLAGIGRREVAEAAQGYLAGLLSGLASKNCWTIAEAVGAADPQAHQRLLRQASWDDRQVGDVRRAWIGEQFGEPEGILVIDETGFVKSGPCSVGVKRQYTGTAGKVENSQVVVFAAYTSSRGRTLYDERLYLPSEWCEDEGRRQQAGVPEEVEFATKLELAAEMVDQALEDRLPVKWVCADTVYGQGFEFRQRLIDQGLRFVMAVPKDQQVYLERPLLLSPASTTVRGRRKTRLRVKGTPMRVDQLAKEFAPSDWRRIRVGEGSKGPRVYDWAARRVAAHHSDHGSQDLWLVVRRSVTRPADRAYYLAWAPAQTPLEVLAGVASRRWQIEECFAEAKGEVGMADYQVRKWRSLHRHLQLAMLAHLLLAQLRSEYGAEDVLGPLSAPEVRRLLEIVLPRRSRSVTRLLNWALWRRKHNHKARLSHYRRRTGRPPKPK